MEASNLNGILNGPTILELTPFQRWLTTSKNMTTTQAIAVCESGSHEAYVRLWREWECDKDSILVVHELPMQVERVYV